MKDLQFIALLGLVALVVLGFLVRMIACVFSSKVRQAVRRRWILHIVWALLAIFCFLVVVVLPFKPNSNYTARAKVLDGLDLGTVARAAVSAFWQEQKRFPASNAEAALSENIDGTYVQSVVIGAQGVVTITYREGSFPSADGAGPIIVLRPKATAAGVEWNCKGGDMPDEYRPRDCRR